MFSGRDVLAEPGPVHGAHGNTCVNAEMEVASTRDGWEVAAAFSPAA